MKTQAKEASPLSHVEVAEQRRLNEARERGMNQRMGAYICPRREISDEGILIIDAIGEWNGSEERACQSTRHTWQVG